MPRLRRTRRDEETSPVEAMTEELPLVEQLAQATARLAGHEAMREEAEAEFEHDRQAFESWHDSMAKAVACGRAGEDEFTREEETRRALLSKREEALARDESVVAASRAHCADLVEQIKSSELRELLSAHAEDEAIEERLAAELDAVRARRAARERPIAVARHELFRARQEFEPRTGEAAMREAQAEVELVNWHANNPWNDDAPPHLLDKIEQRREEMRLKVERERARIARAAGDSWRAVGVQGALPWERAEA
jgi:hypothetical protein